MQGWTSILLMIALGAGFALISVFLSNILGPRHPTPAKAAPYECGMPAVGDARERQSVKFYLVAMIFLLFDIEIAFLYPWAMALRDLGWTGLAQVVLFMLLLLAAGLFLLGAVAYFDLPVASLPTVDFPTLRVQASRPGADPQTMAATIAGCAPAESCVWPGSF